MISATESERRAMRCMTPFPWLVAVLAALLQPCPVGAEPGPAAPKADSRAAVQALLDRAAQQPPWQALQTLEEADRLAAAAPDAAGELSVARQAQALGMQALRNSRPALARRFFQQSLAVAQKQAPGSLLAATSLSDLGRVVQLQADLPGAK